MASMEKTKFFVATGIMICVMGLGFIALSGTSALSDGYGTPLDISSLGFFGESNSGACVAQKGTSSCSSELALVN
ncbi:MULTISPECIES: hypothetical protein [Cohaesibacter]|uniref:hypothetical protein n=1 Tax=Cohaesibacter TaxID=655352 RepID=UPI000DEB7CE1|nr:MULTISPECIES: hypothetical protein [Cohaesibacter]TLP49100.1 hypothetical protein FDK21_05560 [Cohaesibacter sp. CAU 1516]